MVPWMTTKRVDMADYKMKASTLSKIKEIGLVNYFDEKWEGELRFNSYREVSDFVIETALNGDDSLFHDAVMAAKAIIYESKGNPEARHVKSTAGKLAAEYGNWRGMAFGLSVISESFSHEEKSEYSEYSKHVLLNFGAIGEFRDVIRDSAVAIVFETGNSHDRQEYSQFLLSSSEMTKYNALDMLNPRFPSDALTLMELCGDESAFVRSSASSMLLNWIPKMGRKPLDAISDKLLELFKEQELSRKDSKPHTSLTSIEKSVLAMALYASDEALSGYSELPVMLMHERDKDAQALGYLLLSRLEARNPKGLDGLAAVPMLDFDVYCSAQRLECESLGMPFGLTDTYKNYIEGIRAYYSAGYISEPEYQKALDLEKEVVSKEKNAMENARMILGLFMRGDNKNYKSDFHENEK